MFFLTYILADDHGQNVPPWEEENGFYGIMVSYLMKAAISAKWTPGLRGVEVQRCVTIFLSFTSIWNC